MSRVFRVEIFYKDGGRQDVNVVAKDDATAREIAIRLDAKTWKDNNARQPAIDYCEISLVLRITN